MISEDAQRVADLHQNGGLNCSQAMLSVYGKQFDLPEPLAIKVASAFGAGMGGMGNVCGAVTGAFLVLGLTYKIGNPTARQDIYHLVQEFAKRFSACHGSISCNELLGFDINTAEGLKEIREKKLTSTICPLLDKSAATILEELLAEKTAEI